MSSDLHERRVNAALASAGTSSDAIYRAALRLCDTYQFKGDLLEFGAGTGNLLNLLLKSGYKGKLTGADILPRPESIPAEIQWVQADLNGPISIRENSFDAIVSTEVIEHLENPRVVFREFSRLLRCGGQLLVTTPNQESIRSLAALILGGHFVAFLGRSYPAHITALLRKDFERICDESDFSLPSFHYTDSGGLPKLPHISWQKLSLGLLKGRLFSDNVAIVTRKSHSLSGSIGL
jgi:2-polyprenyl-3-methyl-5-hydroxy-6-metoxy-1,4-benzoquinol methylase